MTNVYFRLFHKGIDGIADGKHHIHTLGKYYYISHIIMEDMRTPEEVKRKILDKCEKLFPKVYNVVQEQEGLDTNESEEEAAESDDDSDEEE